MPADADEELLYLLIAVPLEAVGRRAALAVPAVHQSRAHLAADELFAVADADSVRPQPHQHHTDVIIAGEQGTQRRHIK